MPLQQNCKLKPSHLSFAIALICKCNGMKICTCITSNNWLRLPFHPAVCLSLFSTAGDVSLLYTLFPLSQSVSIFRHTITGVSSIYIYTSSVKFISSSLLSLMVKRGEYQLSFFGYLYITNMNTPRDHSSHTLDRGKVMWYTELLQDE